MNILLLEGSRNGGSRLLCSGTILGAYALRRRRSLGLGGHVDTIMEEYWVDDLVVISFAETRDIVH